MSDERELIDREAMKITAALVFVAGALVGWQVGGGWQDTIGGAVIAVMGWLATTPLQALRAVESPVWREVWGNQLPWVLIVLIIVAAAANRGIVL